MNTTTSKDGTKIAYLSLGSGPDLIVVPGALAVAADFLFLANELSGNFTVHVMERRGRSESSSQGEDYSIQKECDDLLALQAKTGAKFAFGHSFGGFLLLEAARGDNVFSKIAVYDPGVSIEGSINMSWVPRLEKEIEQQKYHDALTTFVQGFDPKSARLPHWLLAQILKLVMKKSEREQKYPLLEGTILEHREEARLDGTYQHYSEISAQVLLMCSSWSTAIITASKLISVLPNAQSVSFPKLNHLAPEANPEQVAKKLAEFMS